MDETRKYCSQQGNQNQKIRSHIFSLICGSKLLVFRGEFIICGNCRNQGGERDCDNKIETEEDSKTQVLWSRKCEKLRG